MTNTTMRNPRQEEIALAHSILDVALEVSQRRVNVGDDYPADYFLTRTLPATLNMLKTVHDRLEGNPDRLLLGLEVAALDLARSVNKQPQI